MFSMTARTRSHFNFKEQGLPFVLHFLSRSTGSCAHLRAGRQRQASGRSLQLTQHRLQVFPLIRDDLRPPRAVRFLGQREQ